MQKLNVGILFGGRSGEHDVSIASARSIVREMDRDKYDFTLIGITQAGEWVTGDCLLNDLSHRRIEHLSRVALLPDGSHCRLYAIEPGQPGEEPRLRALTRVDVIFPVLHGTFGEDGSPQGMLEMLGIPYVGADVLASALIMDKAMFKMVMKANGLQVLPSLTFHRRQIAQAQDEVVMQAEGLAPYPLFTKPVNLGSSVGIARYTNRAELIAGLQDAARYDLRVMAEAGLTAPLEIEVSVLGNRDPVVSLPGQIVPSDSFYSYAAKYINGRSELIVPARLSDEMTSRVQSLALRAYQVCGCSGMARADFLVEPASGQVYISELNTIPGFTSISMYPRAWQASGLSYPDLIDRLITLALERKAEQDTLVRVFDPLH